MWYSKSWDDIAVRFPSAETRVTLLTVGLEIKQELVLGSLSSARKVALSVAGAIGGMIVPALIFAVITLAYHEGFLLLSILISAAIVILLLLFPEKWSG